MEVVVYVGFCWVEVLLLVVLAMVLATAIEVAVAMLFAAVSVKAVAGLRVGLVFFGCGGGCDFGGLGVGGVVRAVRYFAVSEVATVGEF